MLQAAIQGRLTQQLPEDGDAKTLYAEIQKEKQRLIKEGKIKKEKLLPEITDDDIPFDIPENWKWVHLCDVGYTQTGNTPPTKSPEYYGNDIPFIGPGDIMLNGTINYSHNALSFLGKDVARIAVEGTILQVCIGGSIGKSAITLKDIAFNQQINSITPILCCSPYLYAVIDSSYFKSMLIDNSGGTATPIINRGFWDRMPFPLPPLFEQKRIVARVDELMKRIDEMEKTEKDIIVLYDSFPGDMKASLLQAAIQGKLTEQLASDGDAETLYQEIQKEKHRLVKEGKIKKEKPLPEITEDDIPFDIPENWKWVHIKSIATIQYGFPFDSNKFNEIGSGMPLIRIRDVVPGLTNTYTTEIYSPEYVVSKGDMLVGMDGNFNVNFWASSDGVLNQRVCRIKANERVILQKYLYYYLPIALGEISDNVSFCTVKHLSDKHFNYMLIPLPPLAEQERIVEKLDQLLPLCDSMKEAIDATA